MSLPPVATGVLGRLFQTRLYRLRPLGVPSRHIQDFLGGLFPTPPYHLHSCKRVHNRRGLIPTASGSALWLRGFGSRARYRGRG